MQSKGDVRAAKRRSARGLPAIPPEPGAEETDTSRETMARSTRSSSAATKETASEATTTGSLTKRPRATEDSDLRESPKRAAEAETFMLKPEHGLFCLSPSALEEVIGNLPAGTDFTIEAGHVRDALHHAVLSSWPESLQGKLLRCVPVVNVLDAFFDNDLVQNEHVRLLRSTTPVFWTFISVNYSAFMTNRTYFATVEELFQREGASLFTEVVWRIIIEMSKQGYDPMMDLLTIVTNYPKRFKDSFPAYLADALIDGCGWGDDNLLPEQYYNMLGTAFGDHWKAKYDAKRADPADDFEGFEWERNAGTSTAISDNRSLHAMINPNAIEVCNLTGFLALSKIATRADRTLEAEREEHTPIQKLEAALQARSRRRSGGCTDPSLLAEITALYAADHAPAEDSQPVLVPPPAGDAVPPAY